jgi:hypothetical protein
MANALLGLLVNWLGIGELSAVKSWTVIEILLQFVPALVQYFTCSLLSVRREGSEVLDMPAFYERQRPAIFTAFSAMMITSMMQNYVDRNNLAGFNASDWIGANLLVLPMLFATLIAGWAKPRWLQWAVGLTMFALEAWFLGTYAVRA